MLDQTNFDNGARAADCVSYGSFRWFPVGRDLYFDRQLLALDSGDLTVMAVLIEQAGAAVDRARLADCMAAGGAVRSGRLWSRVAALNARLKELAPAAGYIAFHPAQGFSLVLPAAVAGSPVGGARARVPGPSRLPVRRAPVLGRDVAMNQVVAKLSEHRLVTILGAGGLGKTTLAIATAQLLGSRYADGVSFVDLAAIAEPRLLVGRVASAMEVEMVSDESVLINLLREKQLLLVLDSCEHLVEPVANMVERILSACSQVHVLATSREPLKSMGERLHRLEPMGLPSSESDLSPSTALTFPSIQLFVQTARLSNPTYELTQENVLATVALCRQLDGVPLAIELIAAHAVSLGIETLAGQVQGRLLALANPVPRRPERHRTLAHMLDWSYGLLSKIEQTVLRRLAIFPRGFHLDAACLVASFDADDTDEITDTILNLIAKSLLASSDAQGHAVLRLLDTTRAYALEKLHAAGDYAGVARRHALYVRDALREAEQAWTAMRRQEWRRTYSPRVDDLRAALGWAFSAAGDPCLSLELTLSAVALATQTALLLDYDEWVNKAVEMLPLVPTVDPETVIRLLSIPLLLPHKMVQEQQTYEERLNRAITMAYEAGKPELAAAPMLVHFSITLQVADYVKSEDWSQKMLRVAQAAADPACRLIGSRMLAQSLHFQGRYAQAIEAIQYVYAHQSFAIPIRYYGSYVAMGVSIRIVMARERWIMGSPDQAEEIARQALELTRDDNPAALCQVYALAAIPIAIWRGDEAVALERLAEFREVATGFNFGFWQEWEKAFSLALASGLLASTQLQSLVNGAEPSSAKMRDHLSTFSISLLAPDTFQRAHAGAVGWCAPEALRAQAERMLLSEEPASVEPAQLLLDEAIDLARLQGATAWELRATMSLARLWRSRGLHEQAHSVLLAIHLRFKEGYGTADLRASALLLAELEQSCQGSR